MYIVTPVIMCPDLKLFSLFLSSSCISEFFDAQSYGTDDGVASEYSSDEEIVSDNEDNEGTYATYTFWSICLHFLFTFKKYFTLDDSDDGNYQDAHYSLSTGEFSSG